ARLSWARTRCVTRSAVGGGNVDSGDCDAVHWPASRVVVPAGWGIDPHHRLDRRVHMRVRRTSRRLSAVALAGLLVVVLAACDDPPTTKLTTVVYNCQANPGGNDPDGL